MFVIHLVATRVTDMLSEDRVRRQEVRKVPLPCRWWGRGEGEASKEVSNDKLEYRGTEKTKRWAVKTNTGSFRDGGILGIIPTEKRE